MARPTNGLISTTFYGAASRTKDVLRKPTPPDIIGVHCPQRQALTRLTWVAAQQDIPPVPYRFLDPKELMGLPGTWALFQLFEGIQLRAAWMRDEIPEVQEREISAAFASVAHPDRKTPYFPEGNVSPRVRRLLLQTGPFKPKIDWATYLINGAEGASFANLTRPETEPVRVPLPENIWLNPDTEIWEVRP